MKTHLLWIVSFTILMAIPGQAPDLPHDLESCAQYDGFCYRGDKCPTCFSVIGICEFHVCCCLRENWRTECEGATTPVDANSPKPTEPMGPQTDPPQETQEAGE